jgi:hypothetical protein
VLEHNASRVQGRLKKKKGPGSHSTGGFYLCTVQLGGGGASWDPALFPYWTVLSCTYLSYLTWREVPSEH